MHITITKVDQIQSGDWHDPSLKWRAVGPGSEMQYFTTKKLASRYASIRRKSRTWNEAVRAFVADAGAFLA